MRSRTKIRVRPAASASRTVDPAPPAEGRDPGALRGVLLDTSKPLFDRFRAIFALRSLQSDEAARALGEALVADAGALLRHECAYVLGQMQREAAIPFLVRALDRDPSPMVRHEAAEALGAIGTDEVIPVLEKFRDADPALEVRQSCELALAHIAYLRDPSRL